MLPEDRPIADEMTYVDEHEAAHYPVQEKGFSPNLHIRVHASKILYGGQQVGRGFQWSVWDGDQVLFHKEGPLSDDPQQARDQALREIQRRLTPQEE